MKSLKASFVSVVVLFLTIFAIEIPIAKAKLVVINFDELPAMSDGYNLIPDYAKLSTQYLSTYGVVFSSGAPYVPVMRIGPWQAPSVHNVITPSSPDGWATGDPQFPIIAKFFDPQNPSVKVTTEYVSITGDLLGGNPSPLIMRAYDVDGNEIGSVSKPDLGGTFL